MRRASVVGLIAYGSFAAIDVILYLLIYPDVALDRVLAYRVAGTSTMLGWYFYARSSHTSVSRMVATSAAVLAGTAVLLGLIAGQLGGLASPYNHGLAFYYVGVAALMPSPWRRTLVMLVPLHLAFFAALGLSSWLDPRHAAQWESPEIVTQLVLFGFFETALLAFASISAHLLWASRAQLYRARRLGRYRLQAPLGRGGMNEVWLARDENLNRDVAIKVLRSAPGVDDDRWLRFEREAQVASSLTSQHTVKIYDYGASDDGIAYIAMEYLRGLDLADLVTEFGPLDVRRAVHVLRQAAASLAEAHERGLVHRDVKPANLFVLQGAEAADFVKVLDFGLVRELTRPVGESTREGVTLGTPSYMAPEQFLGADVTPASDVYALGATLYFLLTGTPPYDDKGGGDTALWRQHSTASLPAVEERRGEAVPAQLERILAQAMAKHPADRYRDATALLKALDDLSEVAPWTAADAGAWWSSLRLNPGSVRRVASSSKMVTVTARSGEGARGSGSEPAITDE